ncbi:MAG: glucose-1-phosphate cytidylyltransferase [Gammaproteobacteria bacterium PRO9]|nr:glucose-1-phosphate cytidylyltransferase [Gammaproteobacteria bacterium PRO9]
MKVVLFCGGLGTRLREHSDTVPKPLVNIGYRPILWHLMRYYAHFGHKDFILCLGYRGDLIREFFLDYREALTNDFVLSEGGRHIELLESDIQDWRITFIDTGMHACIGERLMAVRSHLAGEEHFLANYSDGLSDVNLDTMINNCLSRNVTASFLSTRSQQSFHAVLANDDGMVTDFGGKASDYWVNGGYFVLRQDIFDYIRPGEELVEEPFRRLIAEGRLMTHRHDGFWRSMDTLKDKFVLDRMHAQDDVPWEVWRRRAG